MATGQKVAIVTGAASGLGRAMALGLAGSGMHVVAVDRDGPALGSSRPPAAEAPSCRCPPTSRSPTSSSAFLPSRSRSSGASTCS